MASSMHPGLSRKKHTAADCRCLGPMIRALQCPFIIYTCGASGLMLFGSPVYEKLGIHRVLYCSLFCLSADTPKP